MHKKMYHDRRVNSNIQEYRNRNTTTSNIITISKTNGRNHPLTKLCSYQSLDYNILEYCYNNVNFVHLS